MIVVDTSALMAIALNEPEAEACIDVLVDEPSLAISATTVTEALIVAAGRGMFDKMNEVIDDLGLEIVPVTEAGARAAAAAYEAWGKGFHSAKLNFGDCFAYALARERGCPLLYVGDDFARTDAVSALTGP